VNGSKGPHRGNITRCGRIFHREIFIRYMTPREIFTSGGVQFTSRNIRTIIELYEIK
jgi:hypothetical protein